VEHDRRRKVGFGKCHDDYQRCTLSEMTSSKHHALSRSSIFITCRRPPRDSKPKLKSIVIQQQKRRVTSLERLATRSWLHSQPLPHPTSHDRTTLAITPGDRQFLPMPWTDGPDDAAAVRHSRACQPVRQDGHSASIVPCTTAMCSPGRKQTRGWVPRHPPRHCCTAAS
jgi:hypothetical protein